MIRTMIRFRGAMAPMVVGLGGLCAQTDWQRPVLLEHVRYPAFAFDSARDRAVVFGGASARGCEGTTWEWDRLAWQRAAPAHSPSARFGAAMVFDAARAACLLFGGFDGNNASLGDTWRYDGVDWVQLAPAQSPPPRSLAAFAFDPGRQSVLMFGGASAAHTNLADTWEWNGTDWLQRIPVHQPPARTGAAMAGDSARQRIVLFGGSCFQLGPCWRMDTWEWDGVDWVDRSPPYPAPTPLARWSHGMVYDPVRARTVLFGGSDEPNHYMDDTWEWDGNSWSEVAPATRPIGRLGFGIGYDPAMQRLLAFGGESWIGLVSDLWSHDGVDWQLAASAMQPQPVMGLHTEATAFDGDRRAVVWFGVPFYAALTPQTWEWDGARWWLMATGSGPQWPQYHRLAWMPLRHRVVLLQPQGGAQQPEQTFEYDGQQWTQLQPAHQTGLRQGFDLALDPRFDRVLLFGGRDAQGLRGSTWQFDGSDWQQVAAAGPSPREGHAMALDAPRGRIVLFGGHDGSSLLADTHEWDGQQWQQRSPANAPPARRDHAMAHDLGRQRLVLNGGNGALGPLADTWEWDGNDWQQRPTPAVTPPNFGHYLAYDFWREQTIAVGGIAGGTWRYVPTQPGTWQTFGRGCGGSVGTPAVWTSFGVRPYGGGPFTVVFAGLPGPLAFAAIGFSSTSWNGTPLPLNLQAFGYPACDLLVEPAVVTSLSVCGGTAAWTLSIPAAPSMVGLAFYQQAMALDPSGPDGLAATPGGAAVVGGR